MDNNQIFYAKGDSPEMIQAFEKARATFRYFWRELSWEARRIIPALDLACVKVAFLEQFPGEDEPTVEHMWINDIQFDGSYVSGVLVNDPESLTNVKNGDEVTIPLDQISDWLYASEGKAYGGFTIHQLRSVMSPEDRAGHDEAWGLDFGDFNKIEIIRDQDAHPEHIIEHPMSINMKESLLNFLKEYPQEITFTDDKGYTMLHREAIAGNRTSVEVLLQQGADANHKTTDGKTALDFARQLQWDHVVTLLEKQV
ncbi:DUF2314 domain-containing protein [Chitinophaga rhizophila]|uniref:DUF2314 domain-containing protein n=1 Tax=Chitinophaga rhizophila TaxID=2866212 RepID=A0ABS7GD29_9BACT|nr:DUF2314 domain-containing protein [Chitinophaga rhizophila]MBW8685583.1 DUF2314 domain-containing protein [Chitinophaga rhizophila]